MPSSTLETRALALVDEAMGLAPSDRDAWLTARTVDDPELARRAMSLLRSSEAAGDVLITGGAGLAQEEDELPPERIGAYRIVERIGQGGMGAVYRGERDQGDFTHVVAIKIIRLGLLSDAVIERFQRERQMLADLAHPNIARLFDGGQTADGRPFIVMEHVVGQPITAWADRRDLPVRQRLALFLKVCAAVAFAHQNLIIHRDLTPGNVLVTAEGEVKLIDFGIAQRPDTAQTDEIAVARMTHTPGFAAPERLAGLSASTLVDVYSVGRILDLLIAPTSAAGDPDLRAVVARATAERPEARYPSVEALAEDVQAWLTGQPVSARAGGRRYILGKFVGRHRRTVTAAAAGVSLLVAALAGTLVAYGSANAARAAEAERFQQVRSLANYMLFELSGRLGRVAGNAEARVSLADRAQVYLAALADSPQADDLLKLEAARGFIALATVQGVAGQPNLGEPDKADRNLERAVDLLRASGLPQARTAPWLAQAYIAQASNRGHRDSDIDSAARLLSRAETVLDGVATSERGAEWRLAQARVLLSRADMSLIQAELDQMRSFAQRADAATRAWPGQESLSRDARLIRAAAASFLGNADYAGDAPGYGLTHFQGAEQAFEALDRELPNDPAVLLARAYNAYYGYAAAAVDDRRPAEVARFLTIGRDTVDRLQTLEPRDSAIASLALNIRQAQAERLSANGDFAAARTLQDDVIDTLSRPVAPDQASRNQNKLIPAHAAMANIARQQGDRAHACRSYASARDLLERLRASDRLLGSAERFDAPLRRNLDLCRTGAPVSAMVELY